MTDMELYRPRAEVAAVTERDVVDGWISVVSDVGNLADYISQTDFVPKGLRGKPAAIAAAILTGRELGIGPMQSLKSIHMVQGVPSLSAEYKRARALAAGHEIQVEETTATMCRVRGRRSGSTSWVTVTWTLDMARRAKLAGKDVWQQYPQRMLQARATSELCDLVFPDASLGLATTEVLEDGDVLAIAEGIDTATGEVTPAAIDPPKPRTARRARTQNPPPAQDGTTPAAASQTAPEVASAGGDLPPLPGEEADYDTPGTVTPPQLTAIWTVLSQVYHFGADEKDQARGVCSQVLGRELASSKDLSKNEAGRVLDQLDAWRKEAEEQGDEARGYLMFQLQSGDTDA